MNRVKHKITVVLALFGVVFIAPVALAQAPAGGQAAIEVIPRAPTITHTQDLEFGEVFRPATSREFAVVCGSGGGATVPPANSDLIAGGSRQCGEVTLTAGDTTVSLNLRFGGSPATDVTLSGGSEFLETAYTLTNAAGANFVSGHQANGILISPPSSNMSVGPGLIQVLYIGGSVTIPADATSGAYTGAYEVIFTIVP